MIILSLWNKGFVNIIFYLVENNELKRWDN